MAGEETRKSQKEVVRPLMLPARAIWVPAIRRGRSVDAADFAELGAVESIPLSAWSAALRPVGE